ncbi:MAG: hypothetical protein U0166_00005, partial [Acidobacteriota bacterium]
RYRPARSWGGETVVAIGGAGAGVDGIGVVGMAAVTGATVSAPRSGFPHDAQNAAPLADGSKQ